MHSDGLGKGGGGVRNQRMNQDHQGKNIEKSPGNLGRLTVTHTPGKNLQQMWVYKTLTGNNDNNNRK